MAWLVGAAVIGQHFELFRVSEFPVTLGFALGIPLLIIICRDRFPVQVPLVLTALLAWTSMVALTNNRDTDLFNFVTTLALLLVGAATITTSFSGIRAEHLQALRKGLWAALWIVVAYSICQVIVGFFGSEALFNPWGDRQYQYLYKPRLDLNPVARAQGFFLEPSYDAFVIGGLAVCLLLLGSRMWLIAIVSLVGMAVAQSATGIVLILLLFVILALKSRPGRAIPIVIAAVIFLTIMWDYISLRLGSIGDVGTSGNFRLLAPLTVLKDVLSTTPFGLPLGSIYDVIPRYGLIMAGVDQTVSLDNGAYVLVYYFGWAGVVGLFAMTIFAIGMVLRSRASAPLPWMAAVWVPASLIFSGGIVAPEYAFMTGLVIAAARASRDRQPIQGGTVPA